MATLKAEADCGVMIGRVEVVDTVVVVVVDAVDSDTAAPAFASTAGTSVVDTVDITAAETVNVEVDMITDIVLLALPPC